MIRKIIRFINSYFNENSTLKRKARKFPRYKEAIIHFDKFKIVVSDFLSVSYQIEDYFFKQDFLLPFSNNDSLKIYDLGANVGIATLYFKTKYPNSTIIAYEADPQIYALYLKNIESNFDKQA